MHHIEVDTVNEALLEGIHYMLENGEITDSRNGAVLVAPAPVVTTYLTPQKRVLFNPCRDANPFFHLMEAIWMMAGKDDVKWPAHFAKNLKAYSDDGVSLWGAYGYRWRNWFNYDQLIAIINDLRVNPTSRRAVLGMWDPEMDLNQAAQGGKDVPCNTHAYFEVRNGKLNMTVCNRSNDVIWGAYGANAVHFSFLQEFMALALGLGVGVYHQFSNNYHIYMDKYPKNKLDEMIVAGASLGYPASMGHFPIMQPATNPVKWLEQAEMFIEDPWEAYPGQDPFFSKVAAPMYAAFESKSINDVYRIQAQDWQLACKQWLQRRKVRA